VHEIETLLAQSRAADTFKAAVRQLCREADYPPDAIHVDGYAPYVKLQRVILHMLASEPHLPVERVAVRARSGCSDFVGMIQVQTATESCAFEFVWDCRWRAEQEGWVDYFGFPDQSRAAREYGWRCFQHWQQLPANGVTPREAREVVES
jgi:hypothetical protein